MELDLDPDPNGLIRALIEMGAMVHKDGGGNIVAECTGITARNDGTVTVNGSSSSLRPKEGYGYDATQDSKGIVRFSLANDN